MQMKHLQLTEDLQEKASLYAAGAMSESERKEYAIHLEADGCELCRSEVLELQSVMHAFAMDLPGSDPSPNVKMRLMAQAELSVSMRGLQNRAPGRKFEWVAWLISATATAALVAALIVNSNLRDEVFTLSSRLAKLETQVGEQRTTLTALTSPQVRVVDLAGQGTTPQAKARIFWIESEHRLLFFVSELPQAPNNQTYQLWFVPKVGVPVSASVFNTNPDWSATFEVPVPGDIGELKAAAVTTEPAGGLPQPSGSFVLLGAL
jgi:anti-sigma-K factor RskA